VIRAVAVVVAASGCVDDAGPRLDAAEPQAASHGAVVSLVGRRLCGGSCETAAGAVRLGREASVVQAPVLSYSDTSAQIAVPAAAPVGPTVVIVTVNEHASNALAFEVLP
jgi:hypothetical protein